MRMLLTAFLACAATAWAQKPCGNTAVYTPCDIAFELTPATAAKHPNPFLTVDVWAEFRSPSYKTYRVPAFWDGGTRMVFRITPLEPGDWTYRLSGNIPEIEGKIDKFSAVAGDATTFIQRASVHHWMHTEGLKPHLYMGADLDDLAGLDARVEQKFTHLTSEVALPAAFAGPDQPNPAWFGEFDRRLTAINSKGLVADVILASSPAQMEKLFPAWQQRERYLRYVVARYAPFNVTWQLVRTWEGAAGSRALLKEFGLALKKMDVYSHPRSSRAATTSSPLGPDGWMDHTINGPLDGMQAYAVGAVEHQLHTVPQVALLSEKDPEAFRKKLWNAAVNGQYPVLTNGAESAANIKAMTGWFNTFSRTRHWDLEPYFDLEGGRAIALPGVEYLVYVEHPGKVEVTVEKHSYDVYWIDPASGEFTKEKKEWKGELYEGTPPDATHDWILHLSRDGKKEGMLKSYKFEAWEFGVPVQEPERSLEKSPFTVVEPATNTVLTVGQPVKYSITLKKKTAGTRRMTYVLMGEVQRDGEGSRMLATGAEGTFTVPPELLAQSEGYLNFRVAALNAPGKIYVMDYVYQVKRP